MVTIHAFTVTTVPHVRKKGGIDLARDEPNRTFDNFLSKILPCYGSLDMRDKSKRVNEIIKYTLSRTSMMFKWDGLPDTIPQRMLELYLQTNGNVCITMVNDNLYAFIGGLGGEPNPYYMPTLYTIANPALDYNVNAVIDDDCVVFPSDSMYMGLLPMMQKYATLIAENELSLYINLINARVPAIVGADSSGVADSANMLFADIEKGKLGVVATNQFFEGLKSLPYSATASHTLTDLLEIEQYLKASLFNEIGLQSNFNMKRERLTDDETALNETALLPLIDDMLNQRKMGANKINDMYGTAITVDLDSGWKLTENSAHTENTNDGGGDNDESENDN